MGPLYPMPLRSDTSSCTLKYPRYCLARVSDFSPIIQLSRSYALYVGSSHMEPSASRLRNSRKLLNFLIVSHIPLSFAAKASQNAALRLQR